MRILASGDSPLPLGLLVWPDQGQRVCLSPQRHLFPVQMTIVPHAEPVVLNCTGVSAAPR